MARPEISKRNGTSSGEGMRIWLGLDWTGVVALDSRYF